MHKSFDAITKRAVRRMTDKANGDWDYVLRIHEKARNLRAHRAAVEFVGSLRRPLPVRPAVAVALVVAELAVA